MYYCLVLYNVDLFSRQHEPVTGRERRRGPELLLPQLHTIESSAVRVRYLPGAPGERHVVRGMRQPRVRLLRHASPALPLLPQRRWSRPQPGAPATYLQAGHPLP